MVTYLSIRIRDLTQLLARTVTTIILVSLLTILVYSMANPMTPLCEDETNRAGGHVGGIADFASSPNSTVWASSHNKCFLSPDSLPQNSLCDYVGMKTPKYDISNWSKDGQDVTDQSGLSLNLTIYHTPGHTPDHVAIWDPEERHLFVGDTLYREAPVFFFIGGSVVAYSKTIGRLRELVDDWSSKTGMSSDSNLHTLTSYLQSHQEK